MVGSGTKELFTFSLTFLPPLPPGVLLVLPHRSVRNRKSRRLSFYLCRFVLCLCLCLCLCVVSLGVRCFCDGSGAKESV